jgi:hypothetical protein
LAELVGGAVLAPKLKVDNKFAIALMKNPVHHDRSKHIDVTTGIAFFAECLRHSAKAILHSAKALPSVTLGKEHSANISSAKGSLPSAFFRTLGKDFAECQKALDKEKHSAN